MITTTRAHTALSALSSVLAAALIVGCASDAPTSPSQPLDLSALFSEMSFGSLSTTPNASGALSLPPELPTPLFPDPITLGIVPSACTYSATTGAFTCPPVNPMGVAFNMVYYLYDGSGKTQSQPDSKTIASIRTVIDAAGTLPPPSGLIGGVGISATDHEVVTLSGILTGPRTLNGTGTTHYDIPPYANSTHLLMDAASVTSNVVLPATGSTSVWPLSGTITSDIITSGATAGSSGTVTTHAVITFNGTRFANAVVSSGGVSKTCTIDLGGLSAGAC